MVFLVISFVLIIIGLMKPEESAQALIGFFFLFLLGLILINNNLEYEVGYDQIYTYGNNFTGYHWDYDYNPPPGPAPSEPFLFHSNRTYVYESYNDSNTHNFGYWLCVVAVIGFSMTLFGLKKTAWRRE